MIPILTSERLTLRGPGPQDVPAITDFYASDRARYVGGPKEEDQAWRQLASEIGHWSLRGYGRWMIDVTDTGQTVGMAGLWYPEGWPEPEIGWDLFEGFEGQGYATEAARAARAGEGAGAGEHSAQRREERGRRERKEPHVPVLA